MAKLLGCIFILALLIIAPTYSQVTFTDVAKSAGFDRSDLFWQTWGDYDNDGYADLAANTL